MILKLETYIPFREEANEQSSFSNKLISELLDLSEKITIPVSDFGEAILKINRASTDEIINLKKSYPSYFEYYLEILHFESIIEFEELFEFKNVHDVSNETLNRALLTSIYQSRFINFIVFTQLGIPGSLLTEKGVFLEDEKFHSDFKRLSTSLIGVAYDENKEWPHIIQLSIEDVWNYIKNRTTILNKKSKSNIENGLNAFTYLFDHFNDSMFNLFWAMAGIEALYAEGEIGIGYQIDKKAKLFLGEPSENKKVLRKLYDYRSKFLHGSMSIPINNAWMDEEDIDIYDNEFYEMAYLSKRLLTATLQKIIKDQITKFEFEFKLIK